MPTSPRTWQHRVPTIESSMTAVEHNHGLVQSPVRRGGMLSKFSSWALENGRWRGSRHCHSARHSKRPLRAGCPPKGLTFRSYRDRPMGCHQQNNAHGSSSPVSDRDAAIRSYINTSRDSARGGRTSIPVAEIGLGFRQAICDIANFGAKRCRMYGRHISTVRAKALGLSTGELDDSMLEGSPIQRRRSARQISRTTPR